jgi:SLT domain-containing protein
MVEKNIKMTNWESNQNNTKSKKQWKIINKISENELTITEVDEQY